MAFYKIIFFLIRSKLEGCIDYLLCFFSSSLSAPLVVEVSKPYWPKATEGSLDVCLSLQLGTQLLPEKEPDFTKLPALLFKKSMLPWELWSLLRPFFFSLYRFLRIGEVFSSRINVALSSNVDDVELLHAAPMLLELLFNDLSKLWGVNGNLCKADSDIEKFSFVLKNLIKSRGFIGELLRNYLMVDWASWEMHETLHGRFFMLYFGTLMITFGVASSETSWKFWDS